MNIVRAFFFQNGVTFLKKLKKGRGDSHPPHLVTRLDKKLKNNFFSQKLAKLYLRDILSTLEQTGIFPKKRAPSVFCS